MFAYFLKSRFARSCVCWLLWQILIIVIHSFVLKVKFCVHWLKSTMKFPTSLCPNLRTTPTFEEFLLANNDTHDTGINAGNDNNNERKSDSRPADAAKSTERQHISRRWCYITQDEHSDNNPYHRVIYEAPFVRMKEIHISPPRLPIREDSKKIRYFCASFVINVFCVVPTMFKYWNKWLVFLQTGATLYFLLSLSLKSNTFVYFAVHSNSIIFFVVIICYILRSENVFNVLLNTHSLWYNFYDATWKAHVKHFCTGLLYIFYPKIWQKQIFIWVDTENVIPKRDSFIHYIMRDIK